MKKLILLITLAFILISFNTTQVDEVISAMKNGNSSQVSKFFDNTIELTLPDKSNSYSRSQAELVLRDFFNTSNVKNFEVLHKGDNPGSQFCIGKLQTKNGDYRTTFYMRQKGDKMVLQELRFEK